MDYGDFNILYLTILIYYAYEKEFSFIAVNGSLAAGGMGGSRGFAHRSGCDV